MASATKLSVNLNKIAWLRNARQGGRPSVTGAAEAVIAAGAYGVTVHPRPDQRHITPQDVTDIERLLRDRHPAIELNIEGNPFSAARDNGYPGFDAIIDRARPDQCTLVPDTDHQLTSDHGWDLSSTAEQQRVADTVARYQQCGARVSLFMDPDPAQIDRVPATGAERIELYTEAYAVAVKREGSGSEGTTQSIARYRRAAEHAQAAGLGVNAGHDLDLTNLAAFCEIPGILEVSIGHALISDALEIGLQPAVRAYLDALRST